MDRDPHADVTIETSGQCRATDECKGPALQGEHCLDHLTLTELQAVAARLRDGQRLDARGATITAERLSDLLSTLSDTDGNVVLPATDFRGATFSGDAVFAGATFGSDAGFEGVTFSGQSDFHGATFKGSVDLARATFNGKARFDGATISGDAVFAGATFNGTTYFEGTAFGRSAAFDGATFSRYADFDGATFSGEGDFDGATFTGDAGFRGVTFSRSVGFVGATFSGEAGFVRATFSGNVGFVEATFSGNAGFRDATFSGNASFVRATFSGNAGFSGATFSGYAAFGGATFSGDVRFRAAVFSSDARFRGATFGGNAGFDKATFSGALELDGASFESDAVLESAVLEDLRELGPCVVAGRAVLDGCVFAERVRITVAARVLSARSATFAGGALLYVRWAEIALDEADFARPSTLSAPTSWPDDHDLEPACFADERQLDVQIKPPDPRPRLMTLRGAQAASLSLANVDLRACRFFGAHGLESLSIEASCVWPHTPARRGRLDRETIAEEHALRGWHDPATRPPPWLEGRDGTEPLTAWQIAALYRALRKAREDDKDEAGAGDLYYGEMEMRRHARSGSSGWRQGNVVLLWLYWLVSGYGLRPARALVALAIVILAGAAVLSQWGFHDAYGDIDPHAYGRSLIFALESALSVLRPPERALSAGGEVTQIALRLLGPLLFALALLAVRARVKR